ncbi:MAG: autotransporter domain-containing protein, partial [Synechococcaceae cyanobacterium]
AQSIGGGGGVGGSADPAGGGTQAGMLVNLLPGSTPRAYAATLNIGGSGGSGGGGGSVSVANSGSVQSVGIRAHGVLAQSIGGGGGSGGSVVTQPGTIGNNINADINQWVAPTISANIGLGGKGGVGGSGDAVTIANSGTVVTAGYGAIGLLAQSIGGGGGFVSGGYNTISNASMLTNQVGQSYATGGAVAVTLGSSASISTSGDGAWALLAQSIGGGGGFLGDPSLPLLTPVSNSVPFVSNKDNHYANGGTVTLNLAGAISTTGTNAHGVVAQSIGGGGGVAGGYRYDPNAQVVMGNAYQFNKSTASTSYSGGGNSISINQTGGTINTSGAGSIGILAQSSGGITSSYVNPYLINISVAGTVSGGSGTGAGILVSGGGNSSAAPNTINVYSGGLVTSASGVNGTAIQANSGYTNVTINSGGTVTGSVDLGSTPGDLTTNAGGTFNAGSTVVVAANTFTNAGNLFPGGMGRIGTTTITGGFAQTASGVLGVDVNSLGSQASDRLIVNGQAQLGGTIVPLASALLPGSLPVVSATSLSGTPQVRNGIAFGWMPSLSNNTLSVTPQPTFRPAWLPISPSQNSLTHYLDQAWSNSDRALAPTFGYLSQLSTGTQYQQVLQAMAPQAHTVQLQNLLNTAPFSLGSSIDCPGDFSSKLLQLDSGCVWVRGAGTWANQSAQNGDPGSALTGASTWLGGQRKLAPGWFLGGALGYGQSWADASNGSGSFSSTGDVYSGSLTLRHVHKAWSVSGSLAFGSGDFQNSRSYVLPAAGSLPGSSGTYRSRVSPWLIGGRLRAAYTIPLNTFFLRPYLDVDLLHAEMPAFVEYGTSGLPLSFSTSQKTALLLSPMLEFGGQKQLDPTTTLRLYLGLGLSVRPDFNWAINTSFSNAFSGNGSYQLFGNAPEVVGRLNLGVQVLKVDGFELRLEYDLSAGDGYVAQVPSAKFTYRF